MNQEKPLCAIVVGHKKTSPGAYNETYHISEFEYNNDIAIKIDKILSDSKIVNTQIIYRRTYKSLPDDINELNPDFIISLHCNAFNKKAIGCEVLYYHKSMIGKKIADILYRYLYSVLPYKKRNRGIKPITSEDRGGYLLKHTNAPCLIAEPFFIDNDEELENIIKDNLVNMYVIAIEEISQNLKKGNNTYA